MHARFFPLCAAQTNTVMARSGSAPGRPSLSSSAGTSRISIPTRARLAICGALFWMGVLVGVVAPTTVMAANTTWSISSNAIFGNYYPLSGSFTVDSSGVLISADLDFHNTYTNQDDIFSTSSNATIGFATNNRFQVNRAVSESFGAVQLTINLTSGETFADSVTTLQLSSSSNARTNGCCSYLNSAAYITNDSIPEPASLALFGVGAAVLGMVRRRRA